MIIQIDGYFHGRVLLSGKMCTRQELKQMYKQARRSVCGSGDFPGLFCSLYHFERVPFQEDLVIDFIIHTDTGRVHSPAE